MTSSIDAPAGEIKGSGVICRLMVFLAVAGCMAASAAQVQVGDVRVATTLTSGTQTLVLRSAGVRKELFMELYVAALYLADEPVEPTDLVLADQPMAIRLHISSGLITSKRMTSAIEQGFRQSLGGESTRFRPQINALLEAFQDTIQKGDVFDIVYVPGSGVHVSKAGNAAIVLGDLAFKRALWGIWLGDDPVDRRLKQQLTAR